MCCSSSCRRVEGVVVADAVTVVSAGNKVEDDATISVVVVQEGFVVAAAVAIFRCPAMLVTMLWT